MIYVYTKSTQKYNLIFKFNFFKDLLKKALNLNMNEVSLILMKSSYLKKLTENKGIYIYICGIIILEIKGIVIVDNLFQFRFYDRI